MSNVCTVPHLRVLAELYPDLLAAAVQRPARDPELGGGLLHGHAAPDGLQRGAQVVLDTGHGRSGVVLMWAVSPDSRWSPRR